LKKKCPICKKGKSRRVCIIKDNETICSKCCAEIRGNSCVGCQHYSLNHQHELLKVNKSSNSKFIAILSPEIDEEVDLALELLEQNQFSVAELKIKQLLEKYPTYHQTNYAMGVIEIQNKNFDEALIYLNKATDIYPIFSEAFYNKAIIYKKKEDLGMMASEFLSLMKIEDSNSELYQIAKKFTDMIVETFGNVAIEEYIKSDELCKRAFEYCDIKDYSKAKEYFEKSIVFCDKIIQTHGNLGLCCAALGQKEKALEHFNRSLEIDPQYEPSIINKSLINSRSPDELKAYFRDIKKIENIRYYKDYEPEKKSLMKRFLEKIKDSI